jgi:hypothetical protein
MTKARTNADNASADIQGVTAGTGLSGGGTSGTVTLTNDMATTIDAKGDLVVGTGADTYSRLAVSDNGSTLVADSSASTGLRWQGSYAGGKNFLINGGFDIWQRSTSNGTAGYQTADRWYQNATQSTTFARESTTVPVSSTYSLKMTANVGSQQMWIQQPIESLSAIRLAGRTIAVAADVSASTSTGMTINVYSSTTVDNTAAGTWGSAITPTSGGSGTAVSGSFTRISGTYAIPSTAKSVMVQIITTGNVANGVVVYIGNAQAEIGSVPTAFTLAGGTLAGELCAAQRYYWRWTAGDAYTPFGMALKTTATAAQWVLQFPVEMRARVTSLEFSSLISSNAAGNGAITAMTLGWWGKNTARIDITNNSIGVADTPTLIQSNNNSSAYFAINAEL